MTGIGATGAPAALARAVEANLTAFHVLLSEWPEIELHRGATHTWTVSRRSFSLCNVVLETQFEAERLDAQISNALAPYAGRSVNVMWKLGPSARPAALAARLLDYGFVARPTLRGMALDLASLALPPATPPGLEILAVDGPERLNLWREAIARGFGWPAFGAQDVADNLGHLLASGREPPFVAYVGIAAGAPVAASMAFYGAGAAGIYHVCTAPDRRGKGVGAAITAAPLADARRRGYDIAVLQATEMGYPVYRRLGFREVCTVDMRLRFAST